MLCSYVKCLVLKACDDEKVLTEKEEQTVFESNWSVIKILGAGVGFEFKFV